jgi:uncharacterized protein YjcR
MSKDADWARIEREYRAGEPVAQIARGHRVSHNTIRKQAKRLGWERACPEPMSEERRQAILARLTPSNVEHKLGELVGGCATRIGENRNA